MHSFLPTFWKYVRPSDILVLAVSGGVDSMVMLDLVLQAHPRENIVVAHFDHAIRGEASDGDRLFVRQYSETHGVDFEEEKKDIQVLADTQKASIEAVARHERYIFLETIRNKYDAKYILTAHHADDQVETVLMNLIKWGKFQWLSGMSRLTGHIFRPLLAETKADILSHAKICNIPYREDASNDDLRYDRNKVRHQIVPVMRELNPSIHRTIEHLVEYAEEMQGFLVSESRRWFIAQEEKLGKRKIFSAVDFEKESPIFQREIVAELYRTAHDGSAHWLSTQLIKEIIRFIIERSNSHGKKDIKKLHLERRGDVIYISQR